ncbi:MAG: hypothetical protein RID09_14625 [Coleofasciculus sp. G1-WW12-02]|uniref:hypothetical protein n=1 Tax=Coleofasciculus sp. G1-WW12-02 TaxID=3068483 RepID=UPI0032F330E4
MLQPWGDNDNSETRPYFPQHSKRFAQSLAIIKESVERTTGQITAAFKLITLEFKPMQPVT